MRWSAEQRIADRGGDKYAVLLALQEFTRCTLQLRGDPDVAAVEKRSERVERSTVQSDADRAAELFLVPNCVPASGQTLCPCNGLRGLAERHAIESPRLKRTVPPSSCALPRASASSASRMRSTVALSGPASIILPKPLRSENRMKASVMVRVRWRCSIR